MWSDRACSIYPSICEDYIIHRSAMSAPRNHGRRIVALRNQFSPSRRSGSPPLWRDTLRTLAKRGAGTGHFQPLTSAPRDHEFIHEGTVIVEVNAQQRKGKQRPGTFNGSDHKDAFSRPHRHTFGPTGGDISQHHCLYEAAG